MARDDLHNTDDLIRIIEEEVKSNIIPTGIAGLTSAHRGAARAEVINAYNVATIAARTTLEPGQVLDVDIINPASQTARTINEKLERASQKAVELARFRPPPAPAGVRITQNARFERIDR
jgi:hypothetical protein